jgi:hypothetical protein
LARQFKSDQTKASFVLEAVDQPRTVPVTAENPIGGRPWFAFLSHFSTLPNGIAAALHLMTFFRLDADPGGAILIAAPTLTIKSASTHTYSPDAFSQSNGIYRWKYASDVADPVLWAYLKPPPKLPAAGDSVIDINTLLQLQTHVVGSDWQRQLTETLTPAFDGPEMILNFFRSQDADYAAVKNGLPKLEDALQRQLKRTLDPKSKSPDGDSLRSSVLLKVAHQFKIPDSAFDTAIDYTHPFLPDPAKFLATKQALLEAVEKACNALRGPAEFNSALVDLWSNSYKQVFLDHPGLDRALAEELGRRQPHFQLLLEIVGDYWGAILPAGKTIKPGTELKWLFDESVKASQAFADKVWANQLLDIAKRAVQQVFDTKTDDPHPPKQLAGDPLAEGITIQIDSLACLQAHQSTEDADDFHRLLSGSILLIREKADAGSAEWRCANLTYFAWRDESGKPILLRDSNDKDCIGVAPSRFQYEHGVRNAFLTYNGHPLVAQSPWTQFSTGPDYVGDEAGRLSPLIEYVNPYGKSGQALLARLVYGRTYEVAIAYIGTAGNLPTELANSGSPASFRLPKPEQLAPKGVLFQRKAPVGDFRVKPLDGTRGAAFPPNIPEGVVPRHRATDENQKVYDPEHHPLVLLIPPPPAANDPDPWLRLNNFDKSSFLLYPPTVDVRVWDRWQPTKDELEAVLRDHHTILNAQRQGKRLTEVPYPDDPAVDGFIISLKRLDGSATAVNPLQDTFKSSGAAHGLSRFQKLGVPVRLKSVTTGAAITGNAAAVEISIPVGQIWRVDIQPTFVETDRFVVKPDPTKATYSMVVEVARPLFTSETDRKKLCADLFHCLKPDFQRVEVAQSASSPKADSAEYPLTVEATDQSKPFQEDLHKAEVAVEQWLWDGRPLYEADATGIVCDPLRSGFPFSAVGELPKDKDFPVDGMLFASREDSDAVIHSTYIDYPTKTTVFKRNLASLEGAQYFRFAVSAYSRYAPLLRSDHFLDSSLPADDKDPKRWLRYVVPCRFQQIIPKPAIQLILPLTESITSLSAKGQLASAYPGFLVTLNEGWYNPKTAGMAEFLESEILLVGLPDEPDMTRYQFGPDPVIDMSEDPYETFAISLPRPEGPIGSTFDDAAGPAPLFNRSSFFQPAPLAPPPEGSSIPDTHPSNDLSFHFVKIRFRRTVVLGGREAKCGVEAPNRRQSDWSDAHWVQILPGANRWRCQYFERPTAGVQWGEVEWLNFTQLQAKESFGWFRNAQAFKRNGRLLVPLCTARPRNTNESGGSQPAPPKFSLFLVVSRVVTDVFGRRDQEAFVGLFDLNQPDQITWPGTETSLVRIVEVQHREALGIQNGNLKDFADALFPKRELYSGWTIDEAGVLIDATADARARIVRISPPIPVEL